MILSMFVVVMEGVVVGVLVSCCVLSPSSSHALSHTGRPPVILSRNAPRFNPLTCSAAEIAAKAAGDATNAVVVVAVTEAVVDAAKEGVFLFFAGVLVGGAPLLNKE